MHVAPRFRAYLEFSTVQSFSKWSWTNKKKLLLHGWLVNMVAPESFVNTPYSSAALGAELVANPGRNSVLIKGYAQQFLN